MHRPSGFLFVLLVIITIMSEIVREFVSGLLNLVEEITRLTPDHVERQFLEAHSARLDEAMNRLRWMRSVLNETVLGAESRSFSEQLVQIEESLKALQLQIFEKMRMLNSVRLQCPMEQGNIGRPRFIITHQQISYLRDFSFKWTEIAELLGVSISKLNRHRSSLGLGSDDTPRFKAISDPDLDVLVRDIVRQLPFSSIRMVQGEMESRGIHVQRERVRASLHRVDSLNIRARLQHVVERRQYRVPGPNSLWHINGNHKLIRWKFVVHGGIDGFSRLCVYLACATNNRAETVKGRFLSATAEFGWPSRVRSDHGMENVDVARQMIARRGTGRGSHITGSSVHNQRIERLWRDYFRCIGILYYNLFYFMEDTEILNPDNDNDMFCLHFIFTPLINQALQLFRCSWNNHKLSTEGNSTPHQLYIKGMLERFGTNEPATRDVFDDDSIEEIQYGIDLDGPTPENRSSNNVQVREVTCPISDVQRTRLEEIVHSLTPCPNHGISLFLAAKDFVSANI